MLAALVALPVVFYLPGAITWAALQRQGSRLALSELVFVQVAFSVFISGWLAFTLAELGHFSLLNLVILLTTYCLGLLIWRRRLIPEGLKAERPTLADASALCLVAVCAALFFWPHEFIFGGADAGVYVSLGAAIARDGTISILASDLPLEARSELLRAVSPEALARQMGIVTDMRFLAFYVNDQHPGRLIPHFYHLFPVWVAMMNSIGGLQLSLMVSPILGVLGCIAVYLTGRSLFGVRVGALAGLILALTPQQIWFSREPLSETLTQFCVFAGVFALSRITGGRSWRTSESEAVRETSRQTPNASAYGLLAGLAMGSAFLTRIDTQPLLLALVSFAVLVWLANRATREHLWFLVPFLVLLVHTAIHAMLFSLPYTVDAYGGLYARLVSIVQGERFLSTVPVALFLVLVLTLMVRLLARSQRLRLPWGREEVLEVGRASLAVLIAGLALYAYFVRPYTETTQFHYVGYSESYIPISNHENLVRLGWYISPVGVFLAVFGCITVIRNHLDLRTSLLVLLGIGYTVLFIYDIMNNPHHIYATRRYVPVVLPAFSLFIGCGLWQMWRQHGSQKAFRALAAVLLVGLLAHLVWVSRVVVRHTEYQGAIEQVASLAEQVPSNAVLLFDNRDLGETLGLPLTFLFGRESYAVQRAQPDGEVLDAAVRKWWAQGREVYWVSASGHEGAAYDRPFEPTASYLIDVPELEKSYYHMPTRITRLSLDLAVFRLLRPGEKPAVTNRVDVGPLDRGRVESGFHGPERLPDGTTFRWTQAEARLILPKVSGERLVLRLGSSRPDGAPPAIVELTLAGESLGTVELAGGFAIYEFPLPPGSTTDRAELVLVSSTFRPTEYGQKDERELGVQVDWIRVD